MRITGWIQISDYSSTDLGEVSFEQAADAVLTFPWAKCVEDFAAKALRDEDVCPPGVGFNSGNDDTFHVYADVAEQWQLFLRLSQPGRILGLFPKPAKTINAEVKHIQHAVDLLRLFFRGDYRRLAAEAAKYPATDVD